MKPQITQKEQNAEVKRIYLLFIRGSGCVNFMNKPQRTQGSQKRDNRGNTLLCDLQRLFRNVITSHFDFSVNSVIDILHNKNQNGCVMNRFNSVFIVPIFIGMCLSAGRLYSADVLAWGYNWLGQLGDGTNTDRFEPVKTHNLTDVIAISAGREHSLAIGKLTGVEE